MNDDQYYRNRNRGSGGDTFFAFVTGLALGAVTILLSNPDNREKLKKTFGDVQDRGHRMLDEAKDKAEEAKKVVGEQTKKLTDTIGDNADRLAKSAEDKARQVRREVNRRT